MKTDRELLELAAKAAGYVVTDYRQAARDALVGPETASLWIDSVSTGWNPLKDDGDALRLAVKLGLIVEVSRQDGWTFVTYTCCDAEPAVGKKHEGDPYAATRRAITIAAAEIGEME